MDIDSQALAGCRVLVTRPAEQANGMVCLLRKAGAIPILMPAIAIVTLRSAALDHAIDSYADFDWILLTSQNAVRSLLTHPGFSVPNLSDRVKLAAVGSATAGLLQNNGLRVTHIANSATAANLGRELAERGVAGQRIFIPSSRIARPELAEILSDAGAIVTQIPTYDTVCPDQIPVAAARSLSSHLVDIATFTSPSTVRNSVQLVELDKLQSLQIACIGPTTAQAAAEVNLQVDIVAEQHTVEGLIEAIVSKVNGIPLKGDAHAG